MFWARSEMVSSARQRRQMPGRKEFPDFLSGQCLGRVPVMSQACGCIATGSIFHHLELHISMVPVALTGV